MQEVNDKGDIDLNDSDTNLVSIVEKIPAQEKSVKEDPTLHLNNQIEELKKIIYRLEVLNQTFKEQRIMYKQKNTELEEEVKEKKCQVRIWKL